MFIYIYIYVLYRIGIYSVAKIQIIFMYQVIKYEDLDNSFIVSYKYGKLLKGMFRIIVTLKVIDGYLYIHKDKSVKKTSSIVN